MTGDLLKLACENIVKNDALVQVLTKETGELTLQALMVELVAHSRVVLHGIEPHPDGWDTMSIFRRRPACGKRSSLHVFRNTNTPMHILYYGPFFTAYHSCVKKAQPGIHLST